MATAASSALVAPSAAVWKVGGGTGSAKEHFASALRLRGKRSAQRNSGTIVCAGGRKKYFEQRLKEKKASKLDDESAVITDVEQGAISQDDKTDHEERVSDQQSDVPNSTAEVRLNVVKKTEEDKKEAVEKKASLDQAASTANKRELEYELTTPKIEEELERQRRLAEDAATAKKRDIEMALAKKQEQEEKEREIEIKKREKAARLEAKEREVAAALAREEVEIKKREKAAALARQKEIEAKERELAEKVARQKEQEEIEIKKREKAAALAMQKEIEVKERELAAARARMTKERERALRIQEETERKRRMEQEAIMARKREIDLALAKERERIARIEAHKREILRLADASTFSGSKMFYYPQSVEAGGEVEIYFNRSITALANQGNVQIMGACNNWRWKSFVAKMQKSELPGDWWTCTIDVPREAYRIDFVFFNGENVYENNATKDFFMLVNGGMDEKRFEDFLTQEKRKEAERLASEQAERERAAAEERRLAEQLAADKADRAESKRIVAEQRERARMVLQKAVRNVKGLWEIEPSVFHGGQTVRLLYNRSSRSLASSPDIWIHGGYNNWQEAQSIVQRLSPSSSTGGDWWSVEVFVPKKAYVLNWVFADGPPEKATLYDNNDYQDFHALVPEAIPEDVYWAEVEQKVYSAIREERTKREDAARKKAEYKARMKEQLKLKTKQSFLQSQSHICFTDPVEIKAGGAVSLFYNPSNTVLNGKPEVWFRHSFNRWAHSSPPLKMLQAGNTSHLKATVQVPEDAYMMDFVFSERGDEHGGLYDNNNGLDYHIPVVGGVSEEPRMSIVHVSVEMAPIAKVGGLGDVVTSLSRAVQELGHNVEVIVPKYDCLNYNAVYDLQEKEAFHWGGTRIRVWNGQVEGLTVHFIEPENGLFWAGCIYGRRDDAHRFEFFCHAALEFLLQSGRHPDIIHCHDWSTAPVAWLFQESYKHYGLSNARIVFTIHNLEFGAAQIGKAMANANMATTVSYTYAKEVSGNSAISPHLSKFHGIRNGIDPDIWDPFDDPHIPVSYTAEEVVDGKKAAKSELQHRLGLQQVDRPLVGIITRLTAQKGIHLIKHAIWRTLDRGGQVVLLGSAPDPRVQNDFVSLSNQLRNSHGDMARLCLTYDEPLSHLIYAGADFILVPSIFEPCGLTQLIAMRYGAIPVVRRTGGLNDTVFDVDHDRDRAKAEGQEPNGFSFEGTDAAGVDYGLNRALSAWYESRDWFNSLCSKVMEQDWSWNRPALDYVELYHGAKK